MATAQGADATALQGWTEHKDPSGFAMQFPKGWSVQLGPRQGSIIVRGLEGEELTVWPIFIPAPRGRGEAEAASAILQKLSGLLVPEARWKTPERAGVNAVRMAGRLAGRLAVSLYAWVACPKGTAGYLYLITTPESRYEQTQAVFAKVLTSFRLTGSTSLEPAVPALRYLKWKDPKATAMIRTLAARLRMDFLTAFGFATANI